MPKGQKPQQKQPRIYAFIDAENARNAAEELGYSDLDYSKLYVWLKNKRNVIKTFLYAGIEQGDTSKEQLYLSYAKPDFLVNLKTVVAYKQKNWIINNVCPHCKKSFARTIYSKDKKKANCDTELTLDIVRYACEDAYDEIIIFSGDGDFLKIYNYLVQEKAKKVTVFSSMAKTSRITNTKIKEAGVSGLINLKDLSGILPHYGTKQTSTP